LAQREPLERTPLRLPGRNPPGVWCVCACVACVCRHVLTVYAPMQQYLTSACVCALAGASAVAEAVPTRGELETTRPAYSARPPPIRCVLS
jgi:hypothetical protein